MRRLLVLLVLVAMAMVLAVPVFAQTAATGDPMSIESMATVAGASVISGVIVQFAGMLFILSARAKRLIAALSGLGLVVGMTVSLSEVVTFTVIALAAYNGMLAGLAASKAQEAITHGLNHRVQNALPIN